MPDKSKLKVVVSGNKPRLSVRMEGKELVVDCARCFADFLRRCRWATDKKPGTYQPRDVQGRPDGPTRNKSDMPALAEANCQGYHGYATFPQDAYDIIVANAKGEPFDIPLSLQGGVTTETPIPTSQADIEAIVDRKLAERAAASAIAAENIAETLADQGPVPERSLDEILDDELGPQSPPMPETTPVDASRAAVVLAEKHGIDLAAVKSAKGDKIDVRDVRLAIRNRK